jgi:hypothetical protein
VAAFSDGHFSARLKKQKTGPDGDIVGGKVVDCRFMPHKCVRAAQMLQQKCCNNDLKSSTEGGVFK